MIPRLTFFILPTVMIKFPFSHRTALVMQRFLSSAPVFLVFPPPPHLLLFALKLPCTLAVQPRVADGRYG
jgi:hypothetical protein